MTGSFSLKNEAWFERNFHQNAHIKPGLTIGSTPPSCDYDDLW